MTAKRVIEVALENPGSHIILPRAVLEDAVKEMEQNRWHDLKADPNDLPTEKQKNILICLERKMHRVYEVATYCGEWIYSGNDRAIFDDYNPECWDVIAWREERL